MRNPAAKRWIAALLGGILASACVQPQLRYSPPPNVAPEPPPRVRTDAIAVRLAAPEGRSEIRVDGTKSGRVHLESSGSRVLVNRREAQTEVRLFAQAGELLSIGDRRYAGSLLVRSQLGQGLEVTNLVDLESYVRGVVAGETVLWSAKSVELEVQAICARSYAVATMQERLRESPEAFLWDDTRDQVYLGADLQPAGSRGAELEAKLVDAVAASRGRVLGFGTRVLDTRFHAACGGRTACFRDIFGEDSTAAALPNVTCPPCANAPTTKENPNRWEFTASRAELARLARTFRIGEKLVRVNPVRADTGGRWLEVDLVGDTGRRVVAADEFRRELGATRMKSTRVESMWPRADEPLQGGLFLSGVGRGHGVGLCQVGGRSLANEGWSALRILTHYYPGSRLGRVDSRGNFRELTGESE